MRPSRGRSPSRTAGTSRHQLQRLGGLPERRRLPIVVTPPPGTYVAGTSQIIPPPAADATTAFSVPICPGDAVVGTANCEVQLSERAPVASVPAIDPRTVYHGPPDAVPAATTRVRSSTTTSRSIRSSAAPSRSPRHAATQRDPRAAGPVRDHREQRVRSADHGSEPRGPRPGGIRYVAGSARLDDVPIEPSVAGLDLIWSGLDFTGTQVRT